MNKPIPILYTIDVSEPAAQFYLADQIRSIDRSDLDRLLAANHPFLCLTLKPTALEFANSHSYARIEIVASTESLAVIELGDERE